MDTNPVLQKLDEIQRVATSKLAEHSARLLAVEQLASRGTGGGEGFGEKSLGNRIIESENFAQFQKGSQSSGAIPVGSLLSKATTILSGTWSSGPQFLPRVAAPPQPALRLRDLLPAAPTTSNLIEWPQETARSGAPGYQYPEATDKQQRDFTYALQSAAVATIAFWIACSKQLSDDSAAFSAYIDARLLYLLESKVESELLFGDAGSGHLKGLCTAASLPTYSAPSDLIDAIAKGAEQLAAAGVEATGAVCNASNIWNARQIKAAGSGNFLIGSPLDPFPPSLWNIPISLSPAMPAGKYLLGDFRTGAMIFDREQSSVTLSREQDRFFVQNLIALLAETRLALAIFAPTSFLYGQLGTGS
jgi:HK97 family phage major capsid protein